MDLTLPVEIKGAPPMLLSIRANIQVPELQLSRDVLDFGPVHTGHAKVFTLQLHNFKQVSQSEGS